MLSKDLSDQTKHRNSLKLRVWECCISRQMNREKEKRNKPEQTGSLLYEKSNISNYWRKCRYFQQGCGQSSGKRINRDSNLTFYL